MGREELFLVEEGRFRRDQIGLAALDQSAPDFDQPIERRGLKKGKISLEVHHLLGRKLRGDFRHPLGPGPVLRGGHQHFAAESPNRLRNPLVIGCNKDLARPLRRNGPLPDMLDHRLSVEVGQRLSGKPSGWIPCWDDYQCRVGRPFHESAFSSIAFSIAVVPTIPTTTPAAWLARRAAIGNGAPAEMASERVLTTVSPAPVTSNTCRASVGIWVISPLLSKRLIPCSPRVIKTAWQPSFFRSVFPAC